MKDSESVRAQQQHHVQQHSCTLDECFELYTKEEQVNNTKTHIILNISSRMQWKITTKFKFKTIFSQLVGIFFSPQIKKVKRFAVTQNVKMQLGQTDNFLAFCNL